MVETKDRTYYEQHATEAEFEDRYRQHEAGKYDAPSVTVDVAIFTFINKVQLLLTKRIKNPYRGAYNLCGT